MFLNVLRTSALALAVLEPAAASAQSHVRGSLLGSTPRGIDVGVADGSDRHLEMALDPEIAIAEPALARALVPGAYVSVVTYDRNVRAVTIVPNASFALSATTAAWDLGSNGDAIASGRILRRLDEANGVRLVLRVGNATRSVDVVAKTPVVALRRGARVALVAAHRVFVIADPSTDGVNDRARRIVVGDGPLQLPF